MNCVIKKYTHHAIPDNCIVVGNPAKVIRQIE